jgi:hypothetical protein
MLNKFAFSNNKNIIVMTEELVFCMWNISSYSLPIYSAKCNSNKFLQLRNPEIVHINYNNKDCLLNFNTLKNFHGIEEKDIVLYCEHNIDKTFFDDKKYLSFGRYPAANVDIVCQN